MQRSWCGWIEEGRKRKSRSADDGDSYTRCKCRRRARVDATSRQRRHELIWVTGLRQLCVYCYSGVFEDFSASEIAESEFLAERYRHGSYSLAVL